MSGIKIFNWNDIAEKYERSTILLGNGSSIAVNNCFSYKSLFEEASKNFKQNSLTRIFDYFETEDFELILRSIFYAKKIVSIIEEADIKKEHHCQHYHRLKWAYNEIKNSLIESVRNVHPDYSDINMNTLKKISKFLSKFDTVLSLNYDLIVYWSALIEVNPTHKFKDCFLHGEFKEDWKSLRKPIYGTTSCTLIFYPHGNLALYKKICTSDELKFKSNEYNNLLNTILEKWKDDVISPLFVSEGTKKQKIRTIKDSYYLSTIYREVLTEEVEKKMMVIYGWGFGEQDMHILSQMKNRNLKNIAVSVYNNNEEFCLNALKKIQNELGKNVRVEFFHSNSQNCWVF